MQFKVPQKIDIEDRIVGPLTMVQFVYAVLGAGAGYVMLNIFPSPISWFFAIPIFIFTFCLVFIKVNGRPFGSFLKNLVVYISNPKTRLWHKSENKVEVEIYQPVSARKSDPYAGKYHSQEEIEKLASVIDKRGQTGT